MPGPDPMNGAMNSAAMGNLGASGAPGGMPTPGPLAAHRAAGHSGKKGKHPGRHHHPKGHRGGTHNIKGRKLG